MFQKSLLKGVWAPQYGLVGPLIACNGLYWSVIEVPSLLLFEAALLQQLWRCELQGARVLGGGGLQNRCQLRGLPVFFVCLVPFLSFVVVVFCSLLMILLLTIFPLTRFKLRFFIYLVLKQKQQKSKSSQGLWTSPGCRPACDLLTRTWMPYEKNNQSPPNGCPQTR